MKKYFGGLPKTKYNATRRTVLKIMSTMSGLSDHNECPYVDTMIEQGLTTKEIDELKRLLDKVWNTTPNVVPPHQVEGSMAEFDRYIAGDR